jgi:hypothetical protein
VSCSDLLDQNPKDQIAGPTFWINQKDADLALSGVYSTLLSSTYNYRQVCWDILAGDANGAAGSALFFNQYASGYIEATSGNIIQSVYSESYRCIYNCNNFLENIDRVAITDDLKKKYKGEVLFIRALTYFQLVEFYGGVPLYTKTITAEEAMVKQSSKADVVAQVLADLEIAIANLPPAAYTGHAVKGSALALKAKVLLHNQQWQGAADAANLVIQDPNFGLSSNYKTIFLNLGQNNNKEIIFSTRYLYPSVVSDQNTVLLPGYINPRNEFIDDFECTDGLPISSSPLYNPIKKKLNRDPRMLLTSKLLTDTAYNSAGNRVVLSGTFSNTGWVSVKAVNFDAATEVLPNGTISPSKTPYSDDDWVLLRYAEVLLIYAEAKNEASGPDASIYTAINAIRARPGINMPAIPAGLTKDQMRTRIMHERRVELGLEGKRYFDIRRWKTAEIYIPTLKDPTGTQYVFNPAKHYLWPFPQTEIDINKQLVQNPLY